MRTYRDINIDISKTLGQSNDLVAISRRWYYGLLALMWIDTFRMLVRVAVWAVHV